MVGSQPTQDTDSTPSMEQVFQMFAQLTGQIQNLTTQSSATQQSITNLTGKVCDLTEKFDSLAEQFYHPRPPKLSHVDARFGSKTKLLLLENEGDPLEKSKPRKEEESKLESKLGIKAKRNWNWREKKMITLKNQMHGRRVADNDVADEPRKEEDKRD
ncbi:hypothetical protein ACLB2K_004560 [Fragaria x ananassa]